MRAGGRLMEVIYTNQMRLLDETGRERIFNGINLVYKGEKNPITYEIEYIPNWDEKVFRWCKENGFNLVRLGIIWDAIEHEKGIYNEGYLDWVQKMLDLCEAHGIYAFLDMHQDLYSCMYADGAPKWATLIEDKLHTPGQLWSDAYLFSDAVKRAFENFWMNKEIEKGMGVQDYYIQTWSHVIGRLKDHPALIGYDFLNEPFPGECSLEIFGTLLGAYAQLTGQQMSLEELVEAFSDSKRKYELLKAFEDKTLYTQMTLAAESLVEAFDTTRLKDFYERMAEAIRKITSKGIIMMENCYFSNLGIPCNIPLLQNKQGEVEPLQAYAPHGYDLVVDTSDIVYASNNRVDVIFDTHRAVQKRLGIPVIVGEWGAHAMYEEGLGHIEYLLDKFDRYKWSQTYWCYHEGIDKAPVMAKLNRPYPQAVCGEILSYGYDRAHQIFTLEWQEDKGVESIIYLPAEPKQIFLDGEVIQSTWDLDHKIINIPNQGLSSRLLKVEF